MSTVDDFMRRFGGNDSISDREATQYYDRFASQDPRDCDFDNDEMCQGATEYLGRLPDDEFQSAARNAYAQAAPQQQEGLLGGLLGALQNRGVGLDRLGGNLGLSSNDPRRMNPDDYARVANYARREHPDAMRETVKEQPWFVKALGNPVVLGALAMAAHKMLNRSRGR